MCITALNRALKLRPELPSKGAVQKRLSKAGDCNQSFSTLWGKTAFFLQQ